MTEQEKQIIERDYDQQDSLSSELSARAAFVSALTGIAAVLVYQWPAHDKHPLITPLLLILLAISFMLYLRIAHGESYRYPTASVKWVDWIKDRTTDLESGKYKLTETASVQAERELSDAYWAQALKQTSINREANRRKTKLLTWAGAISIAVVVIVILADAIVRIGVFLYQAAASS